MVWIERPGVTQGVLCAKERKLPVLWDSRVHLPLVSYVFPAEIPKATVWQVSHRRRPCPRCPQLLLVPSQSGVRMLEEAPVPLENSKKRFFCLDIATKQLPRAVSQNKTRPLWETMCITERSTRAGLRRSQTQAQLSHPPAV